VADTRRPTWLCTPNAPGEDSIGPGPGPPRMVKEMESNGRLAPKQRIELKRRYATGDYPNKAALAAEFGISRQTLYAIVTGIETAGPRQMPAKAIRGLRVACGLELAEFADLLDRTPAAVWQWEIGNKTPGRETMIKLWEFARTRKLALRNRNWKMEPLNVA